MDIRKQTLWYTAGNGVYLISLWLLTVFTTRFLGYTAAGDLTLAMAVGNVFALLQLYGVRGFQSSDMSYQYAPADYLRARLVTVGLGLILCLAACLILGYTGALLATVLIFLLFKTSETFSDVLFGEMQRRDRLELAGYSMLFRSVLTALVFLAGAYVFRRLNTALLLTAAFVILLSLLFDLPIYQRMTKEAGNASPGGIRGVLRDCFPLLITALIPSVVTALPRVALERYFGAELLGYYGNVSTPALLITTVAPAVLTAFLPGYGRAVREGDQKRILRTWGLTVLGILGLGAVCVLGALLLARPVLALFYTEAILPYIRYLYPLLGAMTLYAVTMCTATALIPMRMNRALLVCALASLVLSLTVSFPLVRAYGIGGAIAALAIPYGVQALIQAIWLLRLCMRGGDGSKKQKEKNT